MIREAAFVAIVLASLDGTAPPGRAPGAIVPNDNRQAAGTLKNGVLTVASRRATASGNPRESRAAPCPWRRGRRRGSRCRCPGHSFASPWHRSPGNAAQLARQAARRARLRQDARDVRQHTIAPTATRECSSRQRRPARTTTPGSVDLSLRAATRSDMELAGAIVVDPPNAPAQPMIAYSCISWWFTVDSTSPSGPRPRDDGDQRTVVAAHRAHRPGAGRLGALARDQSDRDRSSDAPPRLLLPRGSEGRRRADSLYTPTQQRLAVTEVVNPFQTMSLSWLPTRPATGSTIATTPDHLSQRELDTDRGISTNVLRITCRTGRTRCSASCSAFSVAPNGPDRALDGDAARDSLIMREKSNVYGEHPGYSFVLGGTAAEATRMRCRSRGRRWCSRRDKPVAITVVNRAKDRAAVHWHGIELESYPDGVPGWSGRARTSCRRSRQATRSRCDSRRRAPARSCTTRTSTSRHRSRPDCTGRSSSWSRASEFDPETRSHVVLRRRRAGGNVVSVRSRTYLMNGEAQPKPMDLRAGTTYRFRLINIADNGPLAISLGAKATSRSTWRAVAKDGADAAGGRRRPSRPAMLMFDPGEIYDFEFTPTKAGTMALTFGPPPPPPGPPPANCQPNLPPPPPTISVQVRVR